MMNLVRLSTRHAYDASPEYTECTGGLNSHTLSRVLPLQYYWNLVLEATNFSY